MTPGLCHRLRRFFRVTATIGLMASAPVSLAATPAMAQEPTLFGALSLAADDLSALPQWQDAMLRWNADEASYRECLAAGRSSCAPLQETVWRSRIDGLGTLPLRERLRQANALVNGLLPTSPSGDAMPDARQPGPWPTPRQAITGQAGSDLARAITKFATLRLAGTPNALLRIVVARDVLRDAPLYLVAATIDNRTYILESTTDRLREAHDAALFVPLYSFNETTRWFHLRPDRAQTVGEGKP